MILFARELSWSYRYHPPPAATWLDVMQSTTTRSLVLRLPYLAVAESGKRA